MRLQASVTSTVERVLFREYATRYGEPGGDGVPALLPQIYLHYDPYTVRELAASEGQVLKRQRMDFLMLLADRSRVVIEVDGKQHYADGESASPRRYAEMVSRGPALETHRIRGLPVRRGRAESDRSRRAAARPGFLRQAP
jgi:hypothetical protein